MQGIKAHLVEQFLGKHSRIHSYFFPAYAPELNPNELVWSQLIPTKVGRGTACLRIPHISGCLLRNKNVVCNDHRHCCGLVSMLLIYPDIINDVSII